MRYTEMFRNEPDVLTVPEAAKLLRIGKNQAYELVKNGSLGAIKLGKKIIIPKPGVICFLCIWRRASAGFSRHKCSVIVTYIPRRRIILFDRFTHRTNRSQRLYLLSVV